MIDTYYEYTFKRSEGDLISDTRPYDECLEKRIEHLDDNIQHVCNRLEKFEEAILDFDGIEWIGQGFAHQIFVVFKNAHPNISIVPINMSDSVESMYNHVVKTN